jgi:Homeodomain-like domain
MGRPLPGLELTAEERQQLAGFAASRSLPHALVARARLLLWAAEGLANQEIAARLNWSKATVGKWRQRFVEHRLVGIYDEIRPGRPRAPGWRQGHASIFTSRPLTRPGSTKSNAGSDLSPNGLSGAAPSKRQRTDRQNQPLRPALQPQLQNLCMDRYDRFHLPITRQTMFAIFWDGTLGTC